MRPGVSAWVPPRGNRAVSALVFLAVVFLMEPLSASGQASSPLDRVEELADAGQIREASAALERWEEQSGGSATAQERARGWYLRGRLAQDGETAELYYLKVVVEASTSRYADDALLRLAQYHLARGDYARGIEYLAQLRREYPTSDLVAEALLWLSRAARSQGDLDQACAAAEQGLREIPPNEASLTRSLQRARAGCRTGAGSYSVQVAAFKESPAAQRLARELLSDGYDAWVLRPSAGDSLFRVRVGRELEEKVAQALMERLVAAGYSPFLVSDSPAGAGEG